MQLGWQTFPRQSSFLGLGDMRMEASIEHNLPSAATKLVARLVVQAWRTARSRCPTQTSSCH